jgi:hypothetical protein
MCPGALAARGIDCDSNLTFLARSGAISLPTAAKERFIATVVKGKEGLMGAMATAEPTNIPLDSALTPLSGSSAYFWASSAIPDTGKATADAQKNAQKSDKINGEKEHSNNIVRAYPGP